MVNIAANRGLASRYARALFDVALAEADVRQVDTSLAAFVALFDQYAPLRRALWNPAVPVARKLGVVSKISALGHYPAPLDKLLKLLAERDHLALLPHLLTAYRRRVTGHLGIVEATVTTATPLAPERLAGIARALAHATGKQVTMRTAIDPAVIGGVVARVDCTVYDGSVARQLERIREKMAGEG
jgi:F-type H+-transporting ATPase subunit delta